MSTRCHRRSSNDSWSRDRQARHSIQRLFLDWIRESSIFNTPVEQHFWFVSDGRKESHRYFPQIYNYPWRLHYVQNLHGGTMPIVAQAEQFEIHHLPSTLSIPGNHRDRAIEMPPHRSPTRSQLQLPEPYSPRSFLKQSHQTSG